MSDSPPGIATVNQWWRLAVTEDRPRHVWHMGKAVQDGFDGFTVQTDDHVWLEARGGGTRSPDGGGTLTAQAKGRVWLQSNDGPLSFVADDKAVFGTAKAGLTLAGKGGVTLLADRNIKGSNASTDDPEADDDDTIDAEKDAADVSAGWGTWWTVVDTATALGLNAMDVAIATATTGLPVPTSPSGWITTVIGAGANFAGAGANFAGLAGAGAPGMSLLAEAGMLIGSPIALNIWGVPGAVLGGAFTTVFGGVSTSVLAGLDAGITAIGPVDLSAVVLTSIASLSKRISPGVELASRTAPTTIEGLLGYTMQGGSVQARSIGLITVDALGWLDIYAPKKQVAFKSNVATTIAVGTSVAFGMTPPLAGLVPESITDLIPDMAPQPKPFVPLPPVLYPSLQLSLPKGVVLLAGQPDTQPELRITMDGIELLHTSDASIKIGADSIEMAVGESTVTFGAASLEADADEVQLAPSGGDE